MNLKPFLLNLKSEIFLKQIPLTLSQSFNHNFVIDKYRLLDNKKIAAQAAHNVILGML